MIRIATVSMVILLATPAVAADTQAVVQAHADRHAARLAADWPSLYHSSLAPLMAPRGPCAWAGENVGQSVSVAEVDAALAASPGHAATAARHRTHHARAVRTEPGGGVVVVDVFCEEARPVRTGREPTPARVLSEPVPRPGPRTMAELNAYVSPLRII